MVEASRFTFKKEERICSDKLLNELFSGKAASLSSYPIHCVWMKVEDESCVPAVRVLVSVSKRKFKTQSSFIFTLAIALLPFYQGSANYEISPGRQLEPLSTELSGAEST